MEGGVLKYKNEPTENDRGKDYGSTTLMQCGWCEYASGSHRYNYCIDGSCSLQKSYSKYATWDKECVFINASKNDIEACVKNHEYSINSARQSIESHEKYIKKLLDLKLTAKDRPCLPDDRSHDHFNIDDEISLFYEDKWVFGNVRNGYRHHDGCVSYRLHDVGPQDIDKGFWGVGVAVPIIMLKTEYDFFKENQGEYKLWCDVAYNKPFNGRNISPAQLK